MVGQDTGRFPNMMYSVQSKAWVDSDIFHNWIDMGLKSYVTWIERDEQIKMKETYLLMDEFVVHKKASCTRAIQELGTEIDYIGRHYTSKLQVLDVGVNKQFKNY